MVQALRLPGAEKEFCSILNDSIRRDSLKLVAPLTRIVQGINQLLVTARDVNASNTSFPDQVLHEQPISDLSMRQPAALAFLADVTCALLMTSFAWYQGIVYRGGVVPKKYVDSFFTVGVKYRVPGFLATSFQLDVAHVFCERAYKGALAQACAGCVPGNAAVIWVVHVDPAGGHNQRHLCRNASLVRKSNVVGEEQCVGIPPPLPRICSRTLVGCFVPLRRGGGRHNPSATSRYGSMLLLLSTDGRSC